MRLPEQPRTMSTGSGNFLLVPIPEYPGLDCVPNKNVKIVVLGASNVGKTGNNKVFSQTFVRSASYLVQSSNISVVLLRGLMSFSISSSSPVCVISVLKSLYIRQHKVSGQNFFLMRKLLKIGQL